MESLGEKISVEVCPNYFPYGGAKDDGRVEECPNQELETNLCVSRKFIYDRIVVGCIWKRVITNVVEPLCAPYLIE